MTTAGAFRPVTMALGSAVLLASLSACSRNNEIDISSGIGITSTRTACPAVGVPLHTGDITTFNPSGSRDTAALDVVATITNVQLQCDDTGAKVYAVASFDVLASRTDTATARSVQLPYFSTVVQGGSAVVAKRLGTVTINFDAGQARGTGRGQAAAYVDKAAATLPADIQQRITRKRKAGDDDAAIDPLTEPDVRAAVLRASFELLVGFQLTADQLEYNVRR